MLYAVADVQSFQHSYCERPKYFGKLNPCGTCVHSDLAAPPVGHGAFHMYTGLKHGQRVS